MTTQDKTRADFDARAKRNGLCIDRAPCQRGVSEKYWSAQTQHTWEGWTAACSQQSAQSQQDALDADRSNGVSWDSGFLTVVYRGVEPGPEAQELCTHPKASAMSWSHAINDRDAAIAAQGSSNV